MSETPSKPERHVIPLKAVCPPSEYSTVFLQGMINRVSVSHLKYGLLADNFPTKVDAIACVGRCVDKYVETGNTEYLIDAANYVMFEFMHPARSDAYFEATDSSGSAGVTYRDMG